MKRYLPILILLIATLPLIIALDKAPIRLWDESRNAMNAIEMSQNNAWQITHFDGKPDMWNTKPPLLIWLQALMIKLIGIHPLAIRIPILIAGIATFIFIFSWIKKLTGSISWAMIAPLILCTAYGYVDFHVIRTGDYDGLLTLFTTIYCLSFYQYIKGYGTKYLYLTGVFIALAVLTKSVAGLLFLPALCIYTILSKQLIPLLKSKHFYVALLITLMPIIGYYALRESVNPGYIQAVFDNELGGRYLNTLENHKAPFNTYFKNILDYKFTYWIPFLIIGTILSFLKSHPWSSILRYLCLLTVSYLLIISISQTKLLWYDAPIYPYMAMISASAVEFIIEKMMPYIKGRKSVITAFSLILIMAIPLYNIIYKVYHSNSEPYDEHNYYLSNYIRKEIINNKDYAPTKILMNGYQPQIDFYIIMAQSQGKKIEKSKLSLLSVGDIVVLQEAALKNKLLNAYAVETLQEHEVNKYKIIAIKPESI